MHDQSRGAPSVLLPFLLNVTHRRPVGVLRFRREAGGLTLPEFAARLQLAGWDISR
jgi:hypothetical protein